MCLDERMVFAETPPSCFLRIHLAHRFRASYLFTKQLCTGSMVQGAHSFIRYTFIYQSFFYLLHYTIHYTSFVMFEEISSAVVSITIYMDNGGRQPRLKQPLNMHRRVHRAADMVCAALCCVFTFFVFFVFVFGNFTLTLNVYTQRRRKKQFIVCLFSGWNFQNKMKKKKEKCVSHFNLSSKKVRECILNIVCNVCSIG